MKTDTAALVVAGGSGNRYGGSVRKQYLKLAAKPVLWWSVQAFQSAPSVGEIILVAPVDDVGKLQQQIRLWKAPKLLTVVAGGATRSESVRHGLKVVPPAFSYVAIHDAVRPLVSTDTIEAVIKQAREHRAAVAAIPSRDTVKVADEKGFIQKTIPRQQVWLAQTPQVFERKLLDKAQAECGDEPVTDDAQLIECAGGRVKLVEAHPSNIKVTVPDDLAIAKHLLSRQHGTANRKQIDRRKK